MTRWRDILITLALLVSLLVVLTMSGCAPTGEWTKHDSMYRDFDHAYYSIRGYKATNSNDLIKSEKGGWWGDAQKVH